MRTSGRDRFHDMFEKKRQHPNEDCATDEKKEKKEEEEDH
jgi:hypothetical protein